MKNTATKHWIRNGLFALLALALVCGFSYYYISETEKDVHNQDRQYLNEIALKNATVIKRTVGMNLDKLHSMAHIIGSQELLSENDPLDILRLEAERAKFLNMGYINLDGQGVTTDNEMFDASDREYFIQARNGEDSVSGQLQSKLDGTFISVHAVPMYHDKKIVGVVFATSSSEALADLLCITSFDGEGYSYIVSSTGAPIVYSNNKNSLSSFFDEIGDKAQAQDVRNNMTQGQDGSLDYRRGGQEMVGAYCKIGVNDWYVASIVAEKVISENTHRVITRNSASVMGAIVLALFLIFLIIRQSRRTRQRLEKIAYYDSLSGAPTLEKFTLDAQRFIHEFPDKNFLMVKFDIDQFKLVNQILGKEVGDNVIRNLVLALRINTPGKYERFARLHDDEFLALHTYESAQDILGIKLNFQKIFHELMGPDFTYYVKIVSGHYYMSQDHCTEITLAIERANMAHQKAKQTGQDICKYDESFANQLRGKKEIENKMKSALHAGEFKLYLQPKYNLKTRTIAGAEALVRWQESENVLVYPSEFIPLFEQNGFVTSLDMEMFKQACGWLRRRKEEGKPLVPISVNFSRLHLLNPHFASSLIALAKEYEIPRNYLEVELTETVIFENVDLLSTLLKQLHGAGFKLSMDDFGTGYSSLGLLKNLAVDTIKIDRSFFTGTQNKERTKSLIESVVLMAKKLNIHTVAEGVEEEEHIDLLCETGCDMVQGFYFAKPMPVEDFDALLL